jgi:hypothetical protein
MKTISFQPDLRPELPLVDGPKEYREQRALFLRIEDLLSQTGLEREFITLSMAHRKIDLSQCSAAEAQSLSKSCTLALRSNIARSVTEMNHREFCIRLADSALLQWFLQVGRVDGVSTFAKSTSDRFAHFIDAQSLLAFNAKVINLLQGDTQADFGLEKAISFEAILFDSTCLKAPIHHPVDWVLLRDATRTLMKATARIRKKGLLCRMPQEPLSFLSDMNTLCMQMTAKHRTTEGKRHRKDVLRKMKKLLNRVQKHAQRHLNLLKKRGEDSDLSPGVIQCIITQIESILSQVPSIIKQAHERIIGGRKIANKEKTLSLYDADVQVITRLVKEQSLPIKSVWGDRGLHSAANEEILKSNDIYSGLCPRDVNVLSERLKDEPELREGLKRRAGTEARISIIIRKFMGTPARAKGFENREMMVGWAVLSHNIWKLARLKQAEAAQVFEPKGIAEAA